LANHKKILNTIAPTSFKLHNRHWPLQNY